MRIKMPNKMMVPQEKISPDTLIRMVENKAKEKSYENALAVSAQFVNNLIKSGKLSNVKDASAALQESIQYVQVNLRKELVAMGLEEISAMLPSENETAQS